MAVSVALRHLLAVSWCMPPALFPRSIQVARLLKGLKRSGWRSTVVTPEVSAHPDDVVLDDRLDALYRDEYELAHVRLSMIDPQAAGWADRWSRRMSGEDNLSLEDRWIRRASTAARDIAKQMRARVLVTFAQPWSDHLIGLAVARSRRRLPWVAHFSDPWVDSIYAADLPTAVQQRDRVRESQVVEHADAVVFTNAYAADLVMAKYPIEWRRKVRVVPHAIDEDLLERAPRTTGSVSHPLRLHHIGNLFAGRRTANALFEALSRLLSRRSLQGRLELVFLGGGSGLDEAREQVFVRRLERIVTFRPSVSYLESLAAMREESDVLVVIDAPATTNVFLPSKTVDYLMAGKPVLALTPAEGPTASMMRELGYPVINPQDVDAIERALEHLLERHDAGSLTPSRLQSGYLRQFSLGTIAPAFSAILDDVTNQSSRMEPVGGAKEA